MDTKSFVIFEAGARLVRQFIALHKKFRDSLPKFIINQ